MRDRKVMVVNKNSNQSQVLKTVVYIMNDGQLKKFNDIKHFRCLHNIKTHNE